MEESVSFPKRLSDSVRRYPCLYDKTSKDHKDKSVILNAWNIVSDELELENGQRAEHLFKNLRKRYSRKRLTLKKMQQSSTAGTDMLKKANEDVNEMVFLEWLIPYMRKRSTRKGDREGSDSDSDVDDDKRELQFLVREDDRDSAYSFQSSRSNKRKIEAEFEEVPRRVPNRDEVEKSTTDPRRSRKSYSYVESPYKDSRECDLFGMLVAKELGKLNSRNQIIAKQQIQNIIYNMQIDEDNHSSYSRSPPNANEYASNSRYQATNPTNNFRRVAETSESHYMVYNSPNVTHVPRGTTDSFPQYKSPPYVLKAYTSEGRQRVTEQEESVNEENNSMVVLHQQNGKISVADEQHNL